MAETKDGMVHYVVMLQGPACFMVNMSYAENFFLMLYASIFRKGNCLITLLGTFWHSWGETIPAEA